MRKNYRLDSEGHSHSGVSKCDESDREWKETLESGLKGQFNHTYVMWRELENELDVY